MVSMMWLVSCIVELLLTVLTIGSEPSKRWCTVALIVLLGRLLLLRGVLGRGNWRNERLDHTAIVDFCVVLHAVQ